MPPRRKAPKKDSTANLGFEAKLWLADYESTQRCWKRLKQAARENLICE